MKLAVSGLLQNLNAFKVHNDIRNKKQVQKSIYLNLAYKWRSQ